MIANLILIAIVYDVQLHTYLHSTTMHPIKIQIKKEIFSTKKIVDKLSIESNVLIESKKIADKLSIESNVLIESKSVYYVLITFTTTKVYCIWCIALFT